ncbi:hypothetical protein JJL45_09185 [Tamlana sp. s12]|uniref:hypothetical protein n=1 Tax=Tamlana sp. s12 TaxID=1630406 RepID=UPI000800F3BF|nr:hypothetical protein [Tamlana sp. s12]OBQ52871.1 hypothetical protein VQ01_13060 [Tamlana sp. s12]QQY81103.1 hypothetical protein JJL45_09185 [Tamlana sp. s12]
MANVKYQRLTIIYPTGTSAGSKRDNEIILDPEMSKAVGVAMYSISNGGIGAVRLGLRDNSGEIQEPTHQDDFIDKGYGDYYARKKPLDIEARGRKVYVTVEIPEVLTSALSFDLVFVLKND